MGQNQCSSKQMAEQKTLDVFRSNDIFGSYTFEVLVPQNGSNDPLSGLQQYIELSGIDKIWGSYKTESTITVAVIDDGVYYNHPDLKGQIWLNEKESMGNNKDDDSNGYIDDKYGWNFLSNNNDVDVEGSHGTTVAGVIGAIRNNGEGIAGINDKVKIMPLIACNDLGCNEEAIINAINYAVDNGARIINMSLSGPKINSFSVNFDEVIQYAWNNGVVIVVAAGNGDITGNQGLDTTTYKISPVCNENANKQMIIGVGASTKDNLYRTDWSNYGSCVDIYALGEGIVSTSSENEFFYNISNGTSFSAPIVTGVASYMLSIFPEMSNTAVYKYLIENSPKGILDAEKVITAVEKTYNPSTDLGNKWSLSKIEKIKQQKLEDEDFSDVSKSPYKDAIADLRKKNIINGYSNGTFKPMDSINRAEFIKIVIGAVGIPSTGNECFSDVHNEWFAGYVCSAKINRIIDGYNDGTFRPSNNINIAEALKIIVNAYKIKLREEKLNESWYKRFIEYAKENNLFLQTFREESSLLSREEMAELIYRISQKK